MSAAITRDLTVGSVPKQLLSFSVPTLLANVMQAMYGMADMIIVGQFVGDSGLSAIGICSEIMVVLTAASTGICTGGTVILAQCMGKKDRASAAGTIGVFFCLMLIVSLALSLAGILLSSPVISIMQTPDAARAQALAYLRCCCTGIIFIFGYNAVCAVFRGLGNSKAPMYFISAACVLNVLLDLLFVAVLHMDAFGAALATVISQGVAFGAAAISLFTKSRHELSLSRGCFRLDRSVSLKILRVGLPNMLQTILVHVSILAVGAMINAYGLAASAANGIGQKVTSIFLLIRQAISAGVSAMTAQNMAAGKPERVKSTVHYALIQSVGLSFVLYLVVVLFPEAVARLFVSDASTIKSAADYLRVVSLSYLFMAPMTMFNALAIGVGNSMRSTFNSILDSAICRIPLCLIFGAVWGLPGIYWGMALSPLSAAISGFVYFRRGSWKSYYLRSSDTKKRQSA